METTAKSRGKYWVLFIIWTIVVVGLLIFIPNWFWVALPFQLTYFVAALDAM